MNASGRGRALMVLGTTSDAGKSLVTAAFCRILSDMGYSVTPFKSQNMSLNSVPTEDGHEISMIQALQCKAAGIKPTYRVNPILLKPTSDMMSQVIVNGRVFGVYGVRDYYGDFIPNHSTEILKDNTDWLLAHYDYMVMEGAGSPAEINIYDRDIANMRAAEAADADCILVVNTEWGGAFAYVLGTVMLMPECDRRRIKAILYNNLRGEPGALSRGIKEIEERTGIPTLGVIPHLKHRLPQEDSESLRGRRTIGNGNIRVGVIRLPRIANFTDLDPLFCEDITAEFVTEPERVGACDLIIIPGTKNSMADMAWMNESGIAAALRKVCGTVPIAGICGGYQMLGRKLSDPHGLEDRDIHEIEGLGLLDAETFWDRSDKITVRNRGTFLPTGEEIVGYQIHVGRTVSSERPLFRIETGEEGSADFEKKVFGTYLHGVFEKPAFRRYLLGLSGNECRDTDREECADRIEESLNDVAESFRKNMDMNLFMKITGAVSRH